MKIYNFISMVLFAGATTLASCSQSEELNGENKEALQGFQISISDNGFNDSEADKTRATESNYSTKFADGDAIGIFAVKGGKIVEEINNRKFIVEDEMWVLSDDGDAIEFKGSEFQKMNFYAYYPYDENITIDPAKADPFETYVKNWKVGNDQSGDNYTKSDLMTSVGTVQGDRLKGKIAFTMEHRMALAVIQMPKIVYKFTNTDVALDDYTLPVRIGGFALNNASATPFYQESTDTYRFLVKPEVSFTVSGSYSGVNEMQYTKEGNLSGGMAKLYKINDSNKIEHVLTVGDFYCADGSIVGKDKAIPDNVIGIIYHVGNPQPSITHPTIYTEEKDPLRRDYPDCKHGLVLALKNAPLGTAEKGRFNTANKYYYATWFRTDEKYKDAYVDTERGSKTAPISGFQGYNNTVLMEVGATISDDYKKGAGNALTALLAYRAEVATPTASTGWYFPSDSDLIALQKVVAAVNASIEKTNGTTLIINNGATQDGTFYWSNTERNNEWLWANTMGSGADTTSPAGSGSLTAKRYAAGNDGFFRMMLAF